MSRRHLMRRSTTARISDGSDRVAVSERPPSWRRSTPHRLAGELMDDAPDEAMDVRAAPEAIPHPAWCDLRLCQPDATGTAGRWHYAIGAAIALVLQEHAHLVGEPGSPMLHVIADQHGEDEPTYCLYSEVAKASSRSGHRGMDLALTRGEAERL